MKLLVRKFHLDSGCTVYVCYKLFVPVLLLLAIDCGFHVGVVTALLGIPVSQVMLGHSHTCVLTQLGTVYTFGGNNYGQCGRDYQPPEEEKKQGEPSIVHVATPYNSL